MCLTFVTKILILNLNALDQKKKKKRKNIYSYRCHKTEKKIDLQRTDQRYHPTWKGLGLGLLFFKMAA